MKLFTADLIHHQGTLRAEHALLVDDAGRIVAAGPAKTVREHPAAAGSEPQDYTGRALVPGTVCAHSHAFQVFLRGAGDHPRDFGDWVTRHLYPLVDALDDASLEAAALLCFTQMIRAGVTSVGEFHYLHNDPAPNNTPRGGDLSRLVIGAARKVGLRVAFLRTLYDVRKRPGQGRMAQDAEAAAAEVRALAREYRDDPHVSILPAPHSLHGATRASIEAGAALAQELDTRWHIHLAEQQDDVAFAQEQHGATPLQVLEDWGVLSERTVLVHGIWLSEQERALLAERGGGLVSNPTTNMALGDGIAALPELIDRGVPVGLGSDMNAAPNVFIEMRIAEYLQRVQQLRMGCIPGRGEEEPDPRRIFDMGTRWGADVLGLETGVLEAGRWADVLVLDLSDPSLLPGAVLGGDALLNTLTSSMVPETTIREVWIGGTLVARDGEPVGSSLSELAARVRQSAAIRP